MLLLKESVGTLINQLYVQILRPNALFSDYILNTSSEEGLEAIVDASGFYSRYKLITSSKNSDDISIDFLYSPAENLYEFQ